MVAPFDAAPRHVATSADGTAIAIFGAWGGGDAEADGGAGIPVLLVHGTGSDHTTWRVTAPLMAPDRPVLALDRRGRGASGDGPRYEAAREAEDVAAAATFLADVEGRPITVIGHSLGGRLALAAALRTPAIGRVVAYEGAPVVAADELAAAERLLAALADDLAAGDRDAVLERFLRDAAGLPEVELAAFRASDLWPLRAATAPQIVRELDAALHDPSIGLDALASVEVPVLQLAGSASPAGFRDGVRALDRRLAQGRAEILDGARHNAHHTHAQAFADSVRRFLAS